METKTATSFRLSPGGRALLVRLARHLGISQASVLEMLIRKEAARQWGKVGKGARG